ncbi:putative uncharacterized protein DDB_G0282499 isoform X1 [Hydra vulgaris]|uniref:putative uncharacterized protein DDB_G0282499 isoform X1 n=2 Tax=Hydra vulgaris TaxID=6087 RepID=UPI001F5F327A|nr:putative uncharacterized protein DDB_G0282499 isoform X1 [Hydra vulgaris]
MAYTSRIVSGYRSQPASCRNSLLIPAEYNVSNFSEDLSSFDIQFKKLMERTEKFTTRVEKLHSVSSNIKKSFRRLDSTVSGLRTHFDGTDDEIADRHRKESLTTEEEWRKFLDAGVLIEKAVELLRQHIHFPKPAFEYSPEERSPYSFDISSNTSLVSMPQSPTDDAMKLQLSGNNNLREKTVSLVKNIETLPLEAIKEETNKDKYQVDNNFDRHNITDPEKNLSKSTFKTNNGDCGESNVVRRNKSYYQVSKDSRDSRTKSLFEISTVDISPWIHNLNSNEVTKLGNNSNISTEKNNMDNKPSNKNNLSTFNNDKKNDENIQDTRNKKSASSSFHEYNTSNRIPLRERLAMKEKEKEEAKNREQVFDSKSLVASTSKQTKIKAQKENGSKEGDSFKSRFLRQFRRNDKNEKSDIEATKERRRTTRKRSDEDISFAQPVLVQEESINKETFEQNLDGKRTNEQKHNNSNTTEQKTDNTSNESFKRISNNYLAKKENLDKELNSKLENSSMFRSHGIESKNFDLTNKQQNNTLINYKTDDHYKNHYLVKNQQSSMFSNHTNNNHSNNVDVKNNQHSNSMLYNNETNKQKNLDIDITNKQQILSNRTDNHSSNLDIINMQSNKNVLQTENIYSTSNNSYELNIEKCSNENSERIKDLNLIKYLNKNTTEPIFKRTIKQNNIYFEDTIEPMKTYLENTIKSIETCFENTKKPIETFLVSDKSCEPLQVPFAKKTSLSKTYFKEESIYPVVTPSKQIDFSRILTVLKECHQPILEKDIAVISKVDQNNLDSLFNNIYLDSLNFENHNPDIIINKLGKSTNTIDVTNQRNHSPNTNHLTHQNHSNINHPVQQPTNDNNSNSLGYKREHFLNKEQNSATNCHVNNLINNTDSVLNFAQKTTCMKDEELTVKSINSFDEMLNEFEKLTNEMHESLQNLNSTAKKKEESLMNQSKSTLNKPVLVNLFFEIQNTKEQTEIVSKLKEHPAFTKKKLFTIDHLDISESEELNKKNLIQITKILDNEEMLLSYDNLLKSREQMQKKSKIPILIKNENNLSEKCEKTVVSEKSESSEPSSLYNFSNNCLKKISTNVLPSDEFKNDVNYRETTPFTVDRHEKNKEKRVSYREKRESHMHLLRKKSSNEENIFNSDLTTSCI